MTKVNNINYKSKLFFKLSYKNNINYKKINNNMNL